MVFPKVSVDGRRNGKVGGNGEGFEFPDFAKIQVLEVGNVGLQ